jgi:hypothetical protein
MRPALPCWSSLLRHRSFTNAWGSAPRPILGNPRRYSSSIINTSLLHFPRSSSCALPAPVQGNLFEARIYAIGLVNGIEITVIYTDRAPDDNSYRPHERRVSGNTSKTEPGTDWKRLRTLSEELHAAITADPDIKPTDEAFWKNAMVVLLRARRP